MNRVVAQYNTANATQVNDRTRRFGFAGGAPNMLMDAKKSGLDCNPIEGGRLLLFLQGKDGFIQAGTDMRGNFRKAYHTNMPIDYMNNVGRAFHLTNDHGFRPLEMLTKLPYETPPAPPVTPPNASEAKANPYLVTLYNEKIKDYEATYDEKWVRNHDTAYTYFDVVHPTLTTECKFGLNKPVQFTDPGVGTSTLVYQVCPTCQLDALKSDATSKRIFEASQTLDSEVLMQLRAKLIEAYEATLLHASNKLAEVEGEIKGRMAGEKIGRTRFNVVDHILLKMLHREERQETNQIELLAQAIVAGQQRQLETAVAPPAPVVPEGGKVMTAEEVAEWEAYKTRKANMAKARASKGGTNANNTE